MGVPLLLWALVATASHWLPATNAEPVPTYFVATSYDLSLDLNLVQPANTFVGTAVVNLRTNDKVPQGAKDFVLFGVGMIPSEVTLTYPNGRIFWVPANSIKTDSVQQTLTIPAKELLKNNSDYAIRMVYTGKYGSETGLFRSTFNDKNYIATRFYPAYSRHVFPSMDQPGNVAPIRLTLNVMYDGKTTPTIVTGMKQESSQTASNVLTAVYSSPMKVPLSSLFFTVGTYSWTSNANFYYPTASTITGATILSVLGTSQTVSSFYASLKMNPVAVVVPGLPVPAVSGLGVAAFSMATATEDADVPSDGQKAQAYQIYSAMIKALYASVVSPKNWNDTWLAESIPAYVAQISFTELDQFKSFKGLSLDAAKVALDKTWSKDSWPVMPNFANTSQVVAFISDPAVHKGATILGMLENILPEASRMKTFVDFLVEKAGTAVSTDDFLSFYAASNRLNASDNFPNEKSLQEVLEPWLTQPGFPAINLQRKAQDVVATETNYGMGSSGDSNWQVPILYNVLSSTPSGNAPTQDELVWLMPSPNAEFKIASVDESSVALINTKGPGLYRTLYDEDSIKLFGQILKKDVSAIPQSARATIIDDSFAFINSMQLKFTTVFKMLHYLKNERDLDPWSAVARSWDDLYSMVYFKDDDLLDQFENFSADLLYPAYMDLGLGINDHDLVKGKTRALIAKRLCDFGDFRCRNDTNSLFQNIDKIESELPFDVIPVVYCNHLRRSTNNTDISQLISTKYSASKSAEEKRSVFSYLACPSNNATMNWYLNQLLVQGIANMTADDVVMAFQEVASRPEHLSLCFDFLVSRFNSLHRSLTNAHKAQMIRLLGERGSTDEHITSLKNLPMINSTVIQDAVDAASKRLQDRQDFMSKTYSDLVEAVFGFTPTPTGPTPGPTPGPAPAPTPTTGPTNATTTTPKPSSATRNGVTAIILLLTGLSAFALF